MSLLDDARRLAWSAGDDCSGPIWFDARVGKGRCGYCARLIPEEGHDGQCPVPRMPRLVAALEVMAQNVRQGPCTAYSADGSSCDDCGAITKPFEKADGTVLPVVPVEQHGMYSRCRWKDQAVALGMEHEANVVLGLIEKGEGVGAS